MLVQELMLKKQLNGKKIEYNIFKIIKNILYYD